MWKPRVLQEMKLVPYRHFYHISCFIQVTMQLYYFWCWALDKFIHFCFYLWIYITYTRLRTHYFQIFPGFCCCFPVKTNFVLKIWTTRTSKLWTKKTNGQISRNCGVYKYGWGWDTVQILNNSVQILRLWVTDVSLVSYADCVTISQYTATMWEWVISSFLESNLGLSASASPS